MTEKLSQLWLEVVAKVRERYGSDSTINRWLAMIKLLGEENGTVFLGVPNRFVLEWIENKYVDSIREILAERELEQVRVELRVDPEQFRAMRQEQQRVLGPSSSAPPSHQSSIVPEDIDRNEHGRGSRRTVSRAPCFDFESFVVSHSSRTAFSAVKQVLENPARVFNPLLLFGGTGSGKTHLLQAVHGEVRRRDSSLRVRYVEGEKFLNHFVLSLKDGSISRFRAQYRQLDFLIFDDVEFLANKTSTQEEFLHTLDALVLSGCQVILASHQHPRKISGLERTMRSRLVSGLVLPLRQPDHEARREILRRHALKLPNRLPEEILDFIAENVRGNVREVIGAFNQVAAHTLLDGRPLDKAAVGDLLGEHLSEERSRLTPESILEAVCRYYRLNSQVVLSRRRGKTVCLARRVAIYLAREYTGHSLAELGRFFGDRNSSTIRASDKKIRQMLDAGSPLRHGLQEIMEILSQPGI